MKNSELLKKYHDAYEKYESIIELNKTNPSFETNQLILHSEQQLEDLCKMLTEQLKIRYKVYIIESPSKDDRILGVSERDHTVQSLKLNGKEYSFFDVDGINSLEESLLEISQDIFSMTKSCEDREVFYPILHISAHGNKEMIGFTDGSRLTWEEFGKKLYNLNIQSGRDIDSLVSELIICMSVCHGESLKDMIKEEGNGTPFYVLIGPEQEIHWSDALIGFSIFYHNLINKEKTIFAAIEAMKAGSTFDYFSVFTDPRLKLIKSY